MTGAKSVIPATDKTGSAFVGNGNTPANQDERNWSGYYPSAAHSVAHLNLFIGTMPDAVFCIINTKRQCPAISYYYGNPAIRAAIRLFLIFSTLDRI